MPKLPSSTATSRPLRALLVDADQDHFTLVRTLLAQASRCTASLDWVRSGDEALSSLKDTPYDISLVAYRLATGRGIDVMREIRAHGVNVPWIVITDTDNRAADLEALDAGASDTLCADHLDADELQDTIMRTIERLRLQATRPRRAPRRPLAAAIELELGNPMALILANLDCLDSLHAPAPATTLAYHQTLHSMLEASLEAVGLPAEDGALESAVDVCTVLDSVLEMAAGEIGSRAAVVRDYRHVPLVVGSESQLVQLFLSVILNATKAIQPDCPEQNRIQIATTTDEDGRAVVEVADTGAVIDAQQLERGFDPYRSADSGGRGLALTRALVSRLGGSVSCHSAAGQMTMFRITLPTFLATKRRSASCAHPTSPSAG